MKTAGSGKLGACTSNPELIATLAPSHGTGPSENGFCYSLVRRHMTPSLHVSMALESDAGNIARMSRDLIEHGLPWTWDAGRVVHAIAAPNVNVAVVRGQQKLIAFGIMEYWDEDAHLVLLAVRPTSQRQGVGTAVLRWLEASAVVAGAKRVRVEARQDNAAARNFYNEHGYHELTIKPHMYSGQLDGIRLEKWFRTSAAGDA